MMKIEGLSASGYNTSSWCMWKWALSYLFKFEDEAGPAALIGKIVHQVCEDISKLCIDDYDGFIKNPNIEELWNNSYNQYTKEEPHIAAKIEDGKLKKVIKGFYDLMAGEYSPIRDNTISVERYFRIPIEENRFKIGKDEYFTIRGLIDRIDILDENTIEILDYKTGGRGDWLSSSKEKKDNVTLKDDIQPRMYHLAAKTLYPKIKNILVTFVYITDGGPVTIPFIDEDALETKNVLYKRFATIKNSVDPERNKTWRCRFCGFSDKKSNACNIVWEEKNELGMDFIENKYQILNQDNRR